MSTKVLVTESSLNGIAEAIRSKNHAATTYKPGEMAAAIRASHTSGITPTGTKQITANGTHDVTQYASANVNVQPNLQSKTATRNGMVTPDSGYDGLSSVVVNVSGGGGGNIIYGTDAPSASAGSDGDVYFWYGEYIAYDSLLPYNDHNLDNWTKNTAAFAEFDNTCGYGNENTLVHTGGDGYERIYVLMSIDQNTDYTFGMKYYSPSGVAGGYGGQLAFGISYASASAMSSSNQLSLANKTNLAIAAASDYTEYSLTFNSGSNQQVYLVIDLNITDGRQCTMKFKDIVFYKDGEPPVAVDGKIIINVYLRQSGEWVDAIGAVID